MAKLTLDAMRDAIEAGLRTAGFYDPNLPDGSRDDVIQTAIRHACRTLGIALATATGIRGEPCQVFALEIPGMVLITPEGVVPLGPGEKKAWDSRH
jgi:hypothetical protein